MTLRPIEKKAGLDKATFAKQHLEPMRPVIMTDIMSDWPAKERWTVDFFKREYGHLRVPVVDKNYGLPGKKYMSAAKEIPFREFLEEIERGPTDLRMFLYNIFRHAPELCADFGAPRIMDGFFENFPFMFFGGEKSVVNLHYDIDMSHVFLSQFDGRKDVMVFPHEQSKNLYHQPYTVKSTVDLLNPDYEKFPALRNLQGYSARLLPGETLFIPSGYWHHIVYTDAGFSMSQRSNNSILTRAKGLLNIATHFVVDKGLNRIWGQGWDDYKIKAARRRAEEKV